jgi:hypothetical protein
VHGLGTWVSAVAHAVPGAVLVAILSASARSRADALERCAWNADAVPNAWLGGAIRRPAAGTCRLVRVAAYRRKTRVVPATARDEECNAQGDDTENQRAPPPLQIRDQKRSHPAVKARGRCPFRQTRRHARTPKVLPSEARAFARCISRPRRRSSRDSLRLVRHGASGRAGRAARVPVSVPESRHQRRLGSLCLRESNRDEPGHDLSGEGHIGQGGSARERPPQFTGLTSGADRRAPSLPRPSRFELCCDT